MDPTLRLQPDQRELTPAQEAEARRFAEERIQAQLSTEPVDEPEAETLLRQAYAVAGLAPPQRIQWVDGPLQLVAVRLKTLWETGVEDSGWASVENADAASVQALVWARMQAGRVDSMEDNVQASEWDNVQASVQAKVKASVLTSVEAKVKASVEASVLTSVLTNVGASVLTSLEDSLWGRWESFEDMLRSGVDDSTIASVEASVKAYQSAHWLAYYRFFDRYLAPNDLHALAHFNERVTGYWLDKEVAVLVRRPRLLSRDAQGRLHHPTGKCLEYGDGWGFYAWHGVRVPERVIRYPDHLTRYDFQWERNLEVRRIIQERMGERFVPEMGGKLIDEGPRGRLYEVDLPNDPERVARYVQVQDATTLRQYFLRVPPTIQTAAEAVAWSFDLSVEAYHPARET